MPSGSPLADAALIALAGAGFGFSLIVAIGAQNAFVLRQGLRREHIAVVILICAASDAVLISVGVGGLGSLLQLAPWLLTVMRVVGAGFLLVYGALAARRALRPAVLSTDASGARASTLAVAGTALALTWLNPHVYLDTIVLLGSVAATHGADRWWFGAGAALASVVWFTGLGLGARLLRPVFARPGAWRVLDALVAAVMLTIAATLLLGLATG
ncbi:LysE/ArgO family amino acid transporter [Galbitalea soli]|uniref:Amino acid transporter n=1 Tax=Galbitalea soli TaxID=1268042 RepID=A0A7C9TNW7_9MICO|nr:LysE/ArgO family amino acid transporter [Galbitalea soli]NEM89959.1 amino acid transporter [Galbitalea soli]NYJ30665.1 L-lysine exporter family protein LysE/ArgO [Galbitalea soli]